MQHDVRTAEADSERAEGASPIASPERKKPLRQEKNFHNFIRLGIQKELRIR